MPSSICPSIASPKSPTGHHFYNIPGSKKKYASVADLATKNPILFRIGHRNSGSFYFEGQGVVASEHYSLDPNSGERCLTTSIEELARLSKEGVPKSNRTLDIKLLEHMTYNKATRTNLVSTTLSFTWVLFFAEINASNWNETDVELLIISMHAVAPRAFTAQRRIDRICSKWYVDAEKKKIRCATYSSQEIIVMDCIPESAIISRVPWTTLRQQLPPWFYSCSYDIKSPSPRGLIPVPKDEQSQRYIRWRNAVRTRLDELSEISSSCWDHQSRREVVIFAMSVLSCQDTTPDDETRAQIQCASRCLLSWSRNPRSSSLDEEDDLEIASIIRRLSRERSTNTEYSSYNAGSSVS